MLRILGLFPCGLAFLIFRKSCGRVEVFHVFFSMPAPNVLRVTEKICPVTAVITALVLRGGTSVKILFPNKIPSGTLFGVPLEAVFPFHLL